ncbi:MAG TPA: DUF4412 domain-containing protein [Verrucomicrobiae bacterium]|jgi:hypothetical protein|nr:DUF4412 domain-containing protein [Verrucomicrobiae bacterium]
MKNHISLIASVIVGLSAATSHAQPQGPPKPDFGGAMSKLFGDNPDFTATMEFHFTGPSGDEKIMSGKMAHIENKSRFEMNLADMQSGTMPPQALARMKQMGMDSMITINRPDKKLSYIIYPNMKAYTETPLQDSGANPADYKAETTKLGSETIDGHDCVKNNVTVTGPDGVPHKSTVWNASDLKNFPIQIQATTETGNSMVMRFKDVKFDKPDSAQFEPPADFTKYDSPMNLIMSRMKNGGPQ